MFDHFKDSTRLSVNDRFLQNQGAVKLSQFIRSHGKVQILEVKSNDIDEGFSNIFQSLQRCPIKTIVTEFNNLGNSTDALRELAKLIETSHRLQYLNFSTNKLTNESLDILASSIAGSGSLKLLELKYNQSITTQGVKRLVDELKRKNNKVLLFVDLALSKVDKEVTNQLEEILKGNRKINPISKQELFSNSMKETRNNNQTSFLPQTSKMGGGGLNNTYTNSFYGTLGRGDGSELNSQTLVRNLENLLDQGRRQTAQTKVRLEQELEQLQRRQKFNARQLIDLEKNCTQLTFSNRNLKFELDKCLSEQQNLQREHSFQVRGYEQKVRQASRQLSELQSRYQQAQDKMDKEHILRMKELSRQWQNRLRVLEDKIRLVEIQNNEIENDIRKNLQKKERLKIENLSEQQNLIQRVEDQQSNRYNLRLNALESKLLQIQQSRQLYLKRNNELINQMQSNQQKNNEQILNLESEIQQLKSKQDLFLKNNRQFISNNQKLSSEIKMKELVFQKLQSEINSLNNQIELKKEFNKEQIDKILNEQMYEKNKYNDDKEQELRKLNQLEKIYRASQIENAKLRQQYIALADNVKINVNKSIQSVFDNNHLY